MQFTCLFEQRHTFFQVMFSNSHSSMSLTINSSARFVEGMMLMTNANAGETQCAQWSFNRLGIVQCLTFSNIFMCHMRHFSFKRTAESECLEKKWKILQEMLMYSLEKWEIKIVRRVRKRDGCLYPGGKTISIAALCITTHDMDIFRLIVSRGFSFLLCFNFRNWK